MQDCNNLEELEGGVSNSSNVQNHKNNNKDKDSGPIWIHKELTDIHIKREIALAKYKQNKSQDIKEELIELNKLYEIKFEQEVAKRIKKNKRGARTWMSQELKDCYQKKEDALATFLNNNTKKNKMVKNSCNALRMKTLKIEVTNRIKRNLLLLPKETFKETRTPDVGNTASTSREEGVPEHKVPMEQVNIESKTPERQPHALTWEEKSKNNINPAMCFTKAKRPAGIPRTHINRYSEISTGASIPTLVRRPLEPSKKLKAAPTAVNVVQPQPLPSVMDVSMDPNNIRGAGLPAYYAPQPTPVAPHLTQMYASSDASNVNRSQLYSPSDISVEPSNQNVGAGVDSQQQCDGGQKRPSAFERLGPPAKQTKLTINLINKEETIRQVVEAEEPKYIPFHERENVINSTDETVLKYLPNWPWKNHVQLRQSINVHTLKSVTSPVKEQNNIIFGKEYIFVLVSITGYPPTWTKEEVLDSLIIHLKDKLIVPCFINFTKEECKFLVKNNKAALSEIRACGFSVYLHKPKIKLSITMAIPSVNLTNFIPKLVLNKRISMGYDGTTKLDLKEFTLQEDVSHVIYFPLNNLNNQRQLVLLATDVSWRHLTELNLSHNRLINLDGFNLPFHTPKLKRLDISHNWIQSLPSLVTCRNLPLNSIKLEGNPLCHDYTDESLYVQVVKTLFPHLKELDGEKLYVTGQMPEFKKNYCPLDAMPVVEKFLETFFPLLNAYENHRDYISNVYDKNAVLTITYKPKLRYNADHKKADALFIKSRNTDQKIYDCVKGSSNIGKLISKWPQMLHDHTTFTVDVMYHTDDSTVFKVTGILKLVAESLAEDELVLAFSRTVCLSTSDGVEYRIKNEMLYWDQPTQEYAKSAFKLAGIQNKPKQLDLKFETTPDERTQELLVVAFMEITQLETKASRRCLQMKEWHFRNALEYFVKLLKLNNTEILFKTV